MARHDLVKRMVNLLNSNECGKINFTIAGIRVQGSDYKKIARKIALGKIQVLNCRKFPAGAGGSYLFKYNVFAFPSTKPPADGVIVHETAHAIRDLHARSVNKANDEVAAYTAQMYFWLLKSPQLAQVLPKVRARGLVHQGICDITPPAIIAGMQRNGFKPCHVSTIMAAIEVANEIMRKRTPQQSLIDRLRRSINQNPQYLNAANLTMNYNGLNRSPMPATAMHNDGCTVLSHR